MDHQTLTERKRPLRVLALLDALARATISPAPLRVVHELAYLANVLAPVFDLSPYSASLLKRRSGPYYPSLQQTLDEMVGRGMVVASELRYVHVPEESRYRLDAHYKLNRELSHPAVLEYRRAYDDTGEVLFLDELAIAYSTLAEDQLGRATLQDARYAHSDVDTNNVIDFGEWVPQAAANFSRNAALSFAPHVNLLPAERLYMYLDHLRTRSAGGR
jgi:hypothetical protein